MLVKATVILAFCIFLTASMVTWNHINNNVSYNLKSKMQKNGLLQHSQIQKALSKSKI